MREDVQRRVLQAAEYMLETGATVRACAARMGVSKTTIHKDVRIRLPKINSELGRDVDRVLLKNLRERHLRGGEATRRKYLEQK